MTSAIQRNMVIILCPGRDKFVFLLPADVDAGAQRQAVECIYLHQIQDSTRRGAVAWGSASALPLSYEATFCVAKSSSSNRLLENDAQPLVRATEAYAMNRYRQFKPQGSEPTSVACVPVLVTNAPIFVARYRPADVSLDSGIYLARIEHLFPVRFIRFTKQFTTSVYFDVRQRTVFIVQASAITEVLRNLVNTSITRPDGRIVLAA